MAFVVITHQSADRTSLLPELLQKHTTMPVGEVTAGIQVEPNQVYLSPPGHYLALSSSILQPMPGDSSSRSVQFPIDYFFRSLAEDQGDRAIGVILSTFAVATLIVRMLMPVLIRKLRQWVIIFSALAISGTCYLVFPWAQSVAPLLVLSFVLGLGLGSAQPVIMSLLYAASPPGRQGEVIGVRTSMLNGSHTFLPLAMGALGAALGMGPVFWSMAAFLSCGAGIAWRRVK